MRDKLLATTARSGLYHLPPGHQKAVEKSAGKLHFQFLPADLSGCRSMADALKQLGSMLRFPEWYGCNFDALFDCLSDPSWSPAPGTIIVIEGSDPLRLADPAGFATLIEVFQAAADARREKDHPFWLLLDSPSPGIAALPEA